MKVLFGFLLVLSGVVFVFLGAKTIIGVKNYLEWDREANAVVLDWKIQEKGGDAFSVWVTYEFLVQGKKFTSQRELLKPYFFNEASAEKAVAKLSKQDWTAFYSQIQPENNTLQKQFPFLSLVHTCLSLGVFVYFCFLRMSVI